MEHFDLELSEQEKEVLQNRFLAARLARARFLDPRMMLVLSQHEDPWVARALAGHPQLMSCPQAAALLAVRPDSLSALVLASRADSPLSLLLVLARHADPQVLKALLDRSPCEPEVAAAVVERAGSWQVEDLDPAIEQAITSPVTKVHLNVPGKSTTPGLAPKR